MAAIIFLVVLILWMLAPTMSLALVAILFVIGITTGAIFTHNERFYKIIVSLLVVNVLLIAFSQLITVSGISSRIPPLEFLIKSDLVYSRFTEIIICSLLE